MKTETSDLDLKLIAIITNIEPWGYSDSRKEAWELIKELLKDYGNQIKSEGMSNSSKFIAKQVMNKQIIEEFREFLLDSDAETDWETLYDMFLVKLGTVLEKKDTYWIEKIKDLEQQIQQL